MAEAKRQPAALRVVQGAPGDPSSWIAAIEGVLPEFIVRQRFFASRGGLPDATGVRTTVILPANGAPVLLALVEATHAGHTDLYFLPVTCVDEVEASAVIERRPNAGLCWLRDGDRTVLLVDATAVPLFWRELLAAWRAGWGQEGRITAEGLAGAERSASHEIRLIQAEQSNSAAIQGPVFVKLYRRIAEGCNPEVEMLEHLTRAGFRYVPELEGTLSYRAGGGNYSLGIAQRALASKQDAWEMVVAAMRSVIAGGDIEGVVAPVRELGARTAQFHAVMAEATGPALVPAITDRATNAELANTLRAEIEQTRERLDGGALPPDLWARVEPRLARLATLDGGWKSIRIHGDLHLGQVVRSDGSFFLLDFEGEPDRSIEERRHREQALRDVAGMLRSLEYAALVAIAGEDGARTAIDARGESLVAASQRAFLQAYGAAARADAIPPAGEAFDTVLWAHILQKVLYEVRYELGHRPGWAWVPLHGLERLLREA